MAILQVKGMDDDLYRALAARAAQDNRSISQEVVKVIQDFLARPCDSARQATEDFLAMSGSWSDERDAGEIAKEIRQDRRSGRRFKGSADVFD